MNTLTKKQNKVKAIIKNEFKINVSSKWFNKYLYYYSKCTQLPNLTMNEAIDNILANPSNFAFFIYGARAKYNDEK